MELFKVCGAVLCVLCICMIFKNIRAEYTLFIRLLITVGTGIISLAVLLPVLKLMEDIAQGTKIASYLPVLIKALGIALTVQITSDICKDSGEGALAQRVEMLGKAEIIVISIPLIKNLLSFCDELI